MVKFFYIKLKMMLIKWENSLWTSNKKSILWTLQWQVTSLSWSMLKEKLNTIWSKITLPSLNISQRIQLQRSGPTQVAQNASAWTTPVMVSYTIQLKIHKYLFQISPVQQTMFYGILMIKIFSWQLTMKKCKPTCTVN